jgi:uncharacterized protein
MQSELITGGETTGAIQDGLAFRVIQFARFLRSRGFKAFSSGVTDGLRGVELVDIAAREDFFSILRMNLVSTDMEWRLFPELFNAFWGLEGCREGEARKEGEGDDDHRKDLFEENLTEESHGSKRVDGTEVQERKCLEGVAYSPVSVLEKRDLIRFRAADIPVAQLLLKGMMSPFRISISRRFRRSRRAGDIDFRRMMKKGLNSEFIPLSLAFKRKRKRLKRLVVLADVSGSMDQYARFIMPFILGLRGIASRAEVFVFSTSLSRITLLIRRSNLEKVLRDIATQVPEWSGGTRIGTSLRQLNDGYGKRYLTRRTVAIIMSDGWDLGAKNLLKKQMEVLSNSVHSVIWLNPVAGDPRYSSLSKAMEMVLPYVDHLLPADNLQCLKKVGRTLSKVMAQ